MEYRQNHSAETALMLGTTSIIAFLYNIVHAGLIHKLSATTVTVLGEAKIVGILLLSGYLLGMACSQSILVEQYFKTVTRGPHMLQEKETSSQAG